APSARQSASVVWTGAEAIIFGGFDGTDRNDMKRYVPQTNTWSDVNSTGTPPSARFNHSAVWTGATNNATTANRMIIWGGRFTDEPDSPSVDDGAIWNKATN